MSYQGVDHMSKKQSQRKIKQLRRELAALKNEKFRWEGNRHKKTSGQIRLPGVHKGRLVLYATKPRMLYWAYGSNLNITRMQSRCPDAKPMTALYLDDASLVFRGVADVVSHIGGRTAGGLW